MKILSIIIFVLSLVTSLSSQVRHVPGHDQTFLCKMKYAAEKNELAKTRIEISSSTRKKSLYVIYVADLITDEVINLEDYESTIPVEVAVFKIFESNTKKYLSYSVSVGLWSGKSTVEIDFSRESVISERRISEESSIISSMKVRINEAMAEKNSASKEDFRDREMMIYSAIYVAK